VDVNAARLSGVFFFGTSHDAEIKKFAPIRRRIFGRQLVEQHTIRVYRIAWTRSR
jgi:hypothetical protein